MGLAIADQLRPAIEAARPVLDAFAPAVRAIGEAASWVKQQLSGIGDWFGQLFQQDKMTYHHREAVTNGARMMTNQIIDAVKSDLNQLSDAGAAMIQSLWDGATRKFDELIAWLRTIPGRILDAVGTIDIGSKIRANLPSFGWLGGGEQTPATPIDGARADGGPVARGKTYLVGERGPELFTPRATGVISPNEVYRSAAASRSAAATAATSQPSSIVIHSNPVFNIHGATDARKIADEVSRLQGQSVKAAFEGSYSD